MRLKKLQWFATSNAASDLQLSTTTDTNHAAKIDEAKQGEPTCQCRAATAQTTTA
jgi:hypothetical protein